MFKYILFLQFLLATSLFAKTPIRRSLLFGNSLVDTAPVEGLRLLDLDCFGSDDDHIIENQSFIVTTMKFLGAQTELSAWWDKPEEMDCYGVNSLNPVCHYIYKFAAAGSTANGDNTVFSSIVKWFYEVAYASLSLEEQLNDALDIQETYFSPRTYDCNCWWSWFFGGWCDECTAPPYYEDPEATIFSFGGNDFFALMDKEKENNPSDASQFQYLTEENVNLIISTYKAQLARARSNEFHSIKDSKFIIYLSPILTNIPTIKIDYQFIGNDVIVNDKFQVTYVDKAKELIRLQKLFNSKVKEWCANDNIDNECILIDIDQLLQKGYRRAYMEFNTIVNANGVVAKNIPGIDSYDQYPSDGLRVCKECEEQECVFMDEVHPNLATNSLAACYATQIFNEEHQLGIDYFNSEECEKVAFNRYYEYDGIKQANQGFDGSSMTYQASKNESEETSQAKDVVMGILVAALGVAIVAFIIQTIRLHRKKKTLNELELKSIA